MSKATRFSEWPALPPSGRGQGVPHLGHPGRHRAFGVAICIAVFTLPPTIGAQPQEPSRAADALVRAGRAPEALELLRDEILKSPDDPRLLYNYGLAAYIAGNYGVARTAWKQVSEGGDRALVGRSLFQLGNIEFKDGAVAKNLGPDTRVAQLERAREFYLLAKAARAGSANENNLRVATSELVGLRLAIAKDRVTYAERILERGKRGTGELRASAERLEEAIRHLESLLAIEPDHAEARALLERARELLAQIRLLLARAAKEELDAKLSKATPQSPERTPIGDEKREKDMDRQAADLAKKAAEVVGHYDRALETPQADPAAQKERAEVQSTASKMLADNAERHIQSADKRPKPSQQIDQLEQARGKLTGALEFTPESRPVQEKKTEVERRIESLAQRQAREVLEQAEKEEMPQKLIPPLTEAQQDLSVAAEIDPEDAGTKQLQKEVDAKLAQAHEARGDEELVASKKTAKETPAQAIAHAEQAAADYGRAERLDKKSASRIEPKRAEALQQIDQLRALLARQSQENAEKAEQKVAKLPEIPDDLRDMQIQMDPRSGRDRQKDALFNTKDPPVLRDW